MAARRTTIHRAPSLWSRIVRSIRATRIHDPVTRAFAIAALSYLAFIATMAAMLIWPSVAIPVVGTVSAGLICGAIVLWVKS
jgi:hypothetical protein